MERIELSADEALANSKANPSRHWFSGNNSPKERLASGEPMTVYHWPKFKLDPSWPVFTIGSCFARNVETALLKNDVPLVTNGFGHPPQRFDSWNEEAKTGGGVKVGQLSRGALNKYTTHSMRIEVERALKGLPLEREGLMEMAEDKWFDPHSGGLKLTDFETATDNRLRIAEATRQALKAKVSFITLGLTETWIDVSNEVPMNHPPFAYLHRRKELFRFVDFEYEEVVAQLRAMIDMLKEAVPEMLFIVTVSPVPHSTFKMQDALVSVTGAKSVLRAAAERLYRTLDYVDYFPSYEIVMNTPRHKAFLDDQLHVKPPLIDHAIGQFMKSYY
jgi:hypothetical protein